MKLNRLSIGVKLALAFALLTLLTASLGFLSWREMLSINQSATDLGTNWLPSIQAIGDVRIAANRVRRSESETFLPASASVGEKYRPVVTERMESLLASERHYAPLAAPGEETRLFELYKVRRQRYEAVQRQLLALPADSRAEATALFLGDSETAFDDMAGTLGEIAVFNRKAGDEAERESRAVFVHAQMALIILLVCIVAIAAALSLWITRLITRPIKTAVSVAEGVASGDLTMVIEAEGTDEPAQLMRALAHMRAALQAVVSDVRANAEGVASASSEISQGNHDLSGRTEQQASALEETAASMEQLSSTVRTNAENAERANELADGASAVAKRSAEDVDAMVSTMKTITESSKNIGEIIGVIDSIAFQTNILALNAAVEAARAGEQGRGFAVVATEVRSLAGRSAEAAKQIKALITASETHVGEGSLQVRRAGTSMREVVDSIERVASLVAEISVATREQSAGISQVGEAVAQMDQATQQNAALVEESAAAASGLAQQAQQLVASVAVFRLTMESRLESRTGNVALPGQITARSSAGVTTMARLPTPHSRQQPALATADDE